MIARVSARQASRAGGIAIVMACVAGCSTLEHGATDDVYILSDPPGAKVTISVDDQTCLTPCQVAVGRQAEFNVFVAKDGFDTATVAIKTRSAAPADATSGALTADYLGRVVDSRDGANLVHVPNPVSVTLKKS